MSFIDRELCSSQGSLLEGAKVEHRDHPLKQDPLLASWAEAVFAALCHKTNWDRLHDHVMKVASFAPEKLQPGRLGRIGVSDALDGLLARGFVLGKKCPQPLADYFRDLWEIFKTVRHESSHRAYPKDTCMFCGLQAFPGRAALGKTTSVNQ